MLQFKQRDGHSSMARHIGPSRAQTNAAVNREGHRYSQPADRRTAAARRPHLLAQ